MSHFIEISLRLEMTYKCFVLRNHSGEISGRGMLCRFRIRHAFRLRAVIGYMKYFNSSDWIASSVWDRGDSSIRPWSRPNRSFSLSTAAKMLFHGESDTEMIMLLPPLPLSLLYGFVAVEKDAFIVRLKLSYVDRGRKESSEGSFASNSNLVHLNDYRTLKNEGSNCLELFPTARPFEISRELSVR